MNAINPKSIGERWKVSEYPKLRKLSDYPKMVVEPPGPNAKKWIKRGEKVLSSAEMSHTPALVLSEGYGWIVKDVDGNECIDFAQSMANCGLSNPKVIEAIKGQLDKILVDGIMSFALMEPRVRLAEELLKIMPGKLKEGKVCWTANGTLACDAAIQLARMRTRKQVIIAHQRSYHGKGGAGIQTSTWRIDGRRHIIPLISNVYHVPYPNCYRCIFKQEFPDCNFYCIDYIKYTFDVIADPSDVAGMIVEPIQSAGDGFVVPPDGYFQRVRKLLSENDILLIADEVYTGMGKTGKDWALDHWDTEPDITAVGKGFHAGLPIYAIVGPSEIMDGIWTTRMGAFGTSDSPILCVAALAKLEIYHKEKLAEKAAKMGGYMMKRLKEITEEHEFVGDVRGKGLMLGMEFVKDRKSKKRAPDLAREVSFEALKKGLVMYPYGNFMRVTPALNIPQELVDKGLEIIDDALKKVKLK
jgi:4-aminobutyrate aminotransferase